MLPEKEFFGSQRTFLNDVYLNLPENLQSSQIYIPSFNNIEDARSFTRNQFAPTWMNVRNSILQVPTLEFPMGAMGPQAIASVALVRAVDDFIRDFTVVPSTSDSGISPQATVFRGGWGQLDC